MSSSEQPKPEPVFRHVDDPDVAWQPIKSQRNADGSAPLHEAAAGGNVETLEALLAAGAELEARDRE